MKIKSVMWCVALVPVIGLGVGAYGWLQRPQVITFETGEKLTLLGVDYGRHHVSPVKLTKNEKETQDRANSFNTYKKALVVWVRQEYDPKRYQNFQYVLSDQAGTSSTRAMARNLGNGNNQQGNQVVAVQIDSFPRRQSKFVLRVQKYGPQGPEFANEKFTIRNPLHDSFTTSWQAESLPATKEDGDLSVTLVKLDTAADNPFNQDDETSSKVVEATFQIQRNGKPISNWQPMSVVSSDVTGNSTSMGIYQNKWKDDLDVAVFQPGLWSDEPVWKIRFELAQQSGFASNELWSIPNLPVEAGERQEFYNYGRRNTNAAFAETDINGIHLKIYRAKQFTDQPQGNAPKNGGFKILANPSLPEGLQLKIVVTDNQGEELQMNGSGSSGNGNTTMNNYLIQDVEGLTNINVTVGLHRNRFVEFMVKPKQK